MIAHHRIIAACESGARRRATLRLAAAALWLVALSSAAWSEDRVRLRLGTVVAKEAQPKPPRVPRPPDLRGSIVAGTPEAIRIETPANPIKKEWVVPIEDVLEVFLDGEPEELRSARGMVAAGDGAGALEQLAIAPGDDRDAGWEQASDAVRAERRFVTAAANALVALRSAAGLEPALAGLRGVLAAAPRSHHAAALHELIGDVLARLDRPDEALAAYDAVATQAPARRIRAEMLKGRLRLDRRQWQEARAALEKAAAVEAPPTDGSAALEKRAARILLVRCHARDGRAAAGIDLARQLIAEADPADGAGLALIYVALAEAQQAAGDKNKDAVISCLAVDAVHNGVPDAHAEALARLVSLWEKENHPERAREARQALEQTYPTSPWLEGIPGRTGS